MIVYEYADRDLLEAREDYFYSALQGPGFLNAYRDARLAVLRSLPDETASRAVDRGPIAYPAPDTSEIVTSELLDALEARPDAIWLNRLVQRFEVTKRIYERYDGQLRKPRGAAYRDLLPYARLAAVLARRTDGAHRMIWLNALLKLNDLLCSQPADARAGIGALLARSLSAELDAVASLEARHGDRADA